MKDNLAFLEAAIAELEGDLAWMIALRAAILRGDEAARQRLLKFPGHRGAPS